MLNWLPGNEVRVKVSQGAVWQGTEPGQGPFDPLLPSPRALPPSQALTALGLTKLLAPREQSEGMGSEPSRACVVGVRLTRVLWLRCQLGKYGPRSSGAVLGPAPQLISLQPRALGSELSHSCTVTPHPSSCSQDLSRQETEHIYGVITHVYDSATSILPACPWPSALDSALDSGSALLLRCSAGPAPRPCPGALPPPVLCSLTGSTALVRHGAGRAPALSAPVGSGTGAWSLRSLMLTRCLHFWLQPHAT